MKLDRNYRNLCRRRHWIGRFIAAILLILSPVSLCCIANASDAPQLKSKTVQLYMKKYKKNDVVFYSGRSFAKTTKISSEEYFKGSPYICTPSGFGRTSHCYNRSAF